MIPSPMSCGSYRSARSLGIWRGEARWGILGVLSQPGVTSFPFDAFLYPSIRFFRLARQTRGTVGLLAFKLNIVCLESWPDERVPFWDGSETFVKAFIRLLAVKLAVPRFEVFGDRERMVDEEVFQFRPLRGSGGDWIGLSIKKTICGWIL
ncbi:hypothetical protein LZ32DRAFT_314920 [Colletotrichum eremochloae]|nr:hypothetical protein LZ32DRAFT_314920 [Colletotrichum eremochloae]